MLLVNFSLELHVGADFGDVFDFHAASVIGDAQSEMAAVSRGLYAHRAARGGKLEGIFQQFIDNFREVILRDRGRSVAKLQDQVAHATGPLGAHLGDALDRLAQVQRLAFAQRVQLGGLQQFNLGEDQKIFYQPMQSFGRIANRFRHRDDLIRLQVGVIVDEDVRETQNAVERGQQFVRERQADVGPQIRQFPLRQFTDGLMFFEPGVDRREQLRDGEGLGEIIVCAEFHPLPHAGGISLAGHQDDWYGSGGGVLAQCSQCSVSVHSFHPHVTQDQVRQLGAGLLDAGDSVVRLNHLEAGVLQRNLDDFPQ